jgi:hypothetical protein
MEDYKEMYLTLFREVGKAIEVLQKAQQTTEDMYVEAEEKANGEKALDNA